MKIQVAIIEDNDDARELLCVALSDSFHVTSYGNAEEALELLPRKIIDVILMDLRLPELDGISLMKRLRAEGVTTPMIMVTADVLGNVCDRALAEGFDAFVAKPILDLKVLIDLIRRLALGKRGDAAVA